jgi:hypothetical protein
MERAEVSNARLCYEFIRWCAIVVVWLAAMAWIGVFIALDREEWLPF